MGKRAGVAMRFWVVAVMLTSFSSWAEDDYRVLDESLEGFPPREMMTRYLDAAAQPLFEKRKARFESLKTPEDIAGYQVEMRKFFSRALGGFPPRTSLNVQQVGGGERDTFRYERLIYESQPGYFVTAVLFLPKTEGPHPAVLVPCGHSSNGKAAETYQKACILLAQHGIAALCYDPVGQGERYYYFNKKGQPINGTTLHHSLVNTGAILAGLNMATHAIWDGMRGIDYLQSRDDIDGERIGCSGNSGGGTLSSYIMALDDRVKVAAPSCYLTSFERLLATIGPQDAEQDIFGQLAYGMDHADYIHMRAPKPTLICAATHDFFDIEGTWDTFREAKQVYARLGFPERVDLVETDAQHGFSKQLREGMVRWMRRWLMGIDEPVVEGEIEILSEEEMQCSPEGQVIYMDGARTTFDLNRQRAERLDMQRITFLVRGTDEERRVKIREMLQAKRYEDVVTPQTESRGRIDRKGYAIEKVVMRPEPGITLPALVFRPKGKPKQAVLYLHGQDKAAEAGVGGELERWVKDGALVVAVDLRGIGETESDENQKNWKFKVGPDWTDFMRAYLQGRSFVGMRVDDIFTATRYALSQVDEGTRIRLHGQGEATVPAYHAAALAPGVFETVELVGGIPSWSRVLELPRAQDQLINAVHGALAVYDFPDLVMLMGDTKLETIDSVVPTF